MNKKEETMEQLAKRYDTTVETMREILTIHYEEVAFILPPKIVRPLEKKANIDPERELELYEDKTDDLRYWLGNGDLVDEGFRGMFQSERLVGEYVLAKCLGQEDGQLEGIEYDNGDLANFFQYSDFKNCDFQSIYEKYVASVNGFEIRIAGVEEDGKVTDTEWLCIFGDCKPFFE